MLAHPPLPGLTQESYEQTTWPMLEQGVLAVLKSESHLQSLERLYRLVHNACCCGLAERVEADLLSMIAKHAPTIARRLAVSDGEGAEAAVREILNPVCVCGASN